MKTWWKDTQVWTWVFLVGGLFLRLWHYALNHVIWYDEAVLLANILSKSYGELLGPLRSEVAAPPLYLWMLKSVYLLVGDEPYVWRALPLLAGCANLFLILPLARRVLTPHGAVFALGILAVSDTHVKLCNTVKPYTLDALIATLLLLGLLRTEHWPTYRRLIALALVAPFVLCLSYPSAFVVGGLLLALWPHDRRSLLTWIIAGAVTLGTFAMLYFGPIRSQRVVKLVTEWELYYPPFAHPFEIPWWFLSTFSGVFQEVCNPSGIVLALVAPLGWWAYWRSERWRLAIAIAGLFAAALLASAIKSYPFGQNRLMMFSTPAVLLLGAMGIEVLARWRLSVAVGLAIAVICVADALSLWRVVVPWIEPDSRGVSRFVKENRKLGEPVLSDEGCYLYYFNGELRPLSDARELPVGGRCWTVIDHYTPEVRREYIERVLTPPTFERVEAESREFERAGAYLYERKR